MKGYTAKDTFLVRMKGNRSKPSQSRACRIYDLGKNRDTHI